MNRTFPVRLARVLAEVTGIHHDRARHYLLESRLSGLVERFNLDSLESLGILLEKTPADEGLWSHVYDAISTGETYFYRDQPGLDRFFSSLPPRSSIGTDPVRILSVGCSSGEEVYTLALMAMEAGRLEDFRVAGIDLSFGQIEKARAGVYGQRSVRRVPEDLLRRAFHQEGTHYRVRDRVRSVTRFSRGNILSVVSPLDSYEGILCRNVIIYFDDETRKKLINIFYRLVSPGGVLLTGTGELLPDGGAPFQIESRNGIVLYHKK
ncbi:CheR family methyltransferase [Leptospirillum ferriphilum]|uniref:protein-glutamate O-methyltransferase n=1 Tax=Leptospirillum ferriphilum TaxID=178606 RepID=A0A1V3SS62_9BACT|nr:protein-glutamate O-methyltransferase CheR [Leptospirillum ferriphilum]OOH69702.1 hypothetical protein BOX24_11805 [Leptospirillum ferriphilum]OOH83924.1 hypothetical protein BOX30_01515 [Leptospirillum ferriphilum]